MKYPFAFLVLLLAAACSAAVAESVSLDTGDGILHGTLLVPESKGPVPVVLIHAGSGPTDRDGNNSYIPGKNNSLKQLAEGLAERGIASLRYDKRGIKASMAAGLSEFDLRFDHYIADAAGWVRWLQADDRFSSVTVAGHSEGSFIGSIAAWRAAADGFVALAGPGRPLFTILREQLGKNLPVRHRVSADEIMASLSRGELVPEPPQEMMIYFRPSVQPYLISWQKYDPAVSIGRFDGPVAIVQGTTDLQVMIEDAELLAAAQPRARLLILEGQNHLFKPVAEMNPVIQRISMGDSTKVFAGEAIDAVAEIAREGEIYHQKKESARERLRSWNPDRAPAAWPAADLTTGEKVGYWARAYLAQGPAAYCFGLAEEGYVTRGRLFQDEAFDCVSFMYRCTELARSRSDDEALLWALRTRFAGADPDSAVDAEGRVDYDRPEHLDFSLDMIRTGIWGRDVTQQLTGAVTDTVGTSRYPADSFHYVAKDSLVTAELQEGDIAWLVLSHLRQDGAMLRQDYGLVVGHLGIILVEDDQVYLAHAASSPLEGHYAEAGLVKVPLLAYLDAVGKFVGVIVTRI